MESEATDPARRGSLTINERVVERIAAKSASRHPQLGARSGGVLGIGEKTDFNALPPVNVTLAGNVASISLKVALRFPADLRTITAQLREGIVKDLRTLADVTAAPVDIEVQWLENAPTARRLL